MPADFEQIQSIISQNLTQIHSRIQAAHERAQQRALQPPTADKLPQLIAVTKYAEPAWIKALYHLGERAFGESRPQQLASRYADYQQEFPGNNLQWHLIGSLQRNKIKQVLGKTACIHSVDSFRLLKALEQAAAEQNLRPEILLQVNISGEASKNGFEPDDLLAQAAELATLQQLQITGLMTMAPQTDQDSEIRQTFRGLAQFRLDLKQRLPDRFTLTELSMGMTGDYEIAIEEGATMIRIGSGLFENCPEDGPE